MDLRWKELPLEYLVGLSIFALLRRLILAFLGIGLSPATVIFNTGVSMIGAVLFFGMQVAVSRGRWMGEGDVWFGGMMGAILGTPLLTAIAVYLAYIIGGIIAMIGLIARTYKRGSRIPFAPALAAGTMIALWHGATLFTWIWRGLS
jgi:prepilin signal peptidase PulO-like enzyme (type II secretory pathway)